MNRPTLATRLDRPAVWLLPLFFVSGATALAYQVLWVRQLVLVFGSSTLAIATLLATFMAGLGAGGLAVARHADRFRRPLAVYGWLEIGIGVYALLFPLLLAAVTPLYLGIWRAAEPGPVSFSLVQFVLAGALLLPPTAAMGATLPLLARVATRKMGVIGARAGTLYAVNTLGAVAGSWFVGFHLLPEIGIRQSTLLAAAGNLLIGGAALLLSRSTLPETPSRIESSASGEHGPVARTVCIAIGLAGFSALVYEVSWSRLLALMLGSSAYVFALILVVFLTGIALGSRIGGPAADRLAASRGTAAVLIAIALLEVAIAVLGWGTMYLYGELPFWYVALFDRLHGQDDPDAVWRLSLILAALIMLPATVLMGMRFPFAVRAFAGRAAAPGRPVGVVFGANSLGAACGAFVAGFVLLPMAGLQVTVLVAAGIGLLTAGLLVLSTTRRASRRRVALVPAALMVLAVVFVAGRPSWDPLLMTAGMYHYVAQFDDHSREGIRRQSADLYDLVYYEEGMSSVVTVGQYKGHPHRWLAVNGKVDASTAEDMPTQLLLALLPLQYAPDARDALVIGLASGVSAGTVAASPRMERIEIVELEPAVSRAARFFDAWNRDVLSDSRAHLVLNDARNHVLLDDGGRWDVVVSEPSNPWISGAANLFTREFFELGRSRLKPGGVWSQWVPIYGMDERDLSAVLQTFAAVFPHVRVYATIEYNDLVLIGSDQPLATTPAGAMQLLDDPALAAELRRAGIRSAAGLTSLYLMDQAGIAKMTGGAPLNTDDNLFIEYSTSRKLHIDTRGDNYTMLMQHAALPDGMNRAAPRDWVELARNYRRRGDEKRAVAAFDMAARQGESAERDSL